MKKFDLHDKGVIVNEHDQVVGDYLCVCRGFYVANINSVRHELNEFNFRLVLSHANLFAVPDLN